MTEIATIDWFGRQGGGGGHLFSLKTLLYFSHILITNVANKLFGLRQANLVLIAYASSKGSGEPAHPRSLARTFAARSYKQ